MKVRVHDHLEALLAQEDTDGDRRITVRDRGPKSYQLGDLTVTGTYALSNLLQLLAAARLKGEEAAEVTPELLGRKPTEQLSAAIRERCWGGLTRRMSRENLAQTLQDPKMPGPPRLYLPADDTLAARYYADCDVELVRLPRVITPEYVLSLNDKPGMLALAHDPASGEPLPYVVPGGRFNECYGWDCYFIGLGLLADGEIELARCLVDHHAYQIEHYGQVLNANRSYYLTRSQPPFLTSFIRAVFEKRPDLEWLRARLLTAMHEYAKVWTGPARLTSCGLSRYHAQGIGMPPETEPGHYHAVCAPFAARAGLSVDQFERAYLARTLPCPELDRYFTHDRTVRESGHDTSYRLEGRAADLCTVDLNSLLFRYEMDIAELLEQHFRGSLPGHPPASVWRTRAAQRQALMTQLCWRDGFYDYDFTQGQVTGYESATNLWPLWAGLATPEQAEVLICQQLGRVIYPGGVAGSSRESRGEISESRPARQWDYPYGWAPHQMLLWEGLRRSGWDSMVSGTAALWLGMVTRNSAAFNGVIPEKYDVMDETHEVFAEYGNVGADFDYLTAEGFGWTNASVQVGLPLLDPAHRQAMDQIPIDA